MIHPVAEPGSVATLIRFLEESLAETVKERDQWKHDCLEARNAQLDLIRKLVPPQCDSVRIHVVRSA